MSQAVWKLTALSVVVAVGVLVVVLAQRGVQEDDAAENEVASTDTANAGETDLAEPAEDIEPPLQGEPDMAADDGASGAIVPAAANSRRRKANVPRRSAALREGDLNDESDPDIQKTVAVDDNPFGDDEEADTPAPRKPSPRLQPARAAASRKAAIDIVDADPDDEDDPALEPTTKAPLQGTRPAPGNKRGPVLMLDAPGADDAKTENDTDDPKEDPSGPRLLGGSDDGTALKARGAKAKADPFPDDDELPSTPGKLRGVSPDADDESDLADDESPPARLPQPGSSSKPKPVAGHSREDDLETEADEMPAINRSAPRPGKGVDDSSANDLMDADQEDDTKLPAEIAAEKPTRRPLNTIETDETDDAPLPQRAGRGAPSGPAIESAPREMPVLPGKPTGEPMLPDSDTPPTDESFADEPPVQHKAPQPQLTIDKVAPSTAVLGEPMVYHIQVRNAGAIPAHNVVVEDVVPDNVKIDGSIPQAQLKQKRMVWKLGTMAPGQEKKIAVRVIPQSEGTIGSVATVNFSPQTQPPPSPNSPRIKFVVESPRKAAVGMPVDFNFKIKNVGTVPATGVTIRDVLPAGLTHQAGDDLEFTIEQIPPGKTQDVKLTLTAAVTGPTVNRVIVTADGNVSEEAEVQLEVVGPKLSVARTGSKKLFPDKVGRYANTVTNPGGHPLSGATLVEVVPAGMEFVEADQGGLYDPAKRSVVWSIKQLNPGEAKTVKVALRATARGAQISVVRAYDSSGASGETVGTTHVAGVPALKIEIGELATLVEPGELVKVPVRVLNRGSDAATNVQTTIPVPVGMQFVSARGPVEHRVAPLAGGKGSAGLTEVQFAPIGKVDAKANAVYELTFKARVPGATRMEVHTRCEQMSEAIRSEEPITIVAPQ